MNVSKIGSVALSHSDAYPHALHWGEMNACIITLCAWLCSSNACSCQDTSVHWATLGEANQRLFGGYTIGSTSALTNTLSTVVE